VKYVEDYHSCIEPNYWQKLRIDGELYDFPLTISWMQKPSVWYRGTTPKPEKKSIRLDRFKFNDTYLWGSGKITFYEDWSVAGWDDVDTGTREYDLNQVKEMLRKQKEFPCE
jgi:hypothetical protein